jgi:hypothetical protein
VNEPKREAERYHEEHIDDLDHDWSSCWCCCITCEHVNPYFDEAIKEMREGRK